MATDKNIPIAQHVSRLNEIFIRDEDKESNALILPGHGAERARPLSRFSPRFVAKHQAPNVDVSYRGKRLP